MELFYVLHSALMGALIALIMLSAIVLYKGGFWAFGQFSYSPPQNKGGIRNNRILRMFFVSMVMTGVLFMSYYVLLFLMDDTNVRVYCVLDALSNMTAGFSLMTTLALQQVRLRLRHWLIYLCPYLPMLIAALTIADSWPVGYRVINFVTFAFTLGTQFYCIHALRRYDRMLRDLYSDIEHKETRWYRSLLAARILVILLWIPLDFWPDMGWIWIVYYVTLDIVHVRATAFAVSHEQFVMEKEAQQASDVAAPVAEDPCADPADSVPTAAKEPEQDEAVPQWFVKMEQLIQTEHVYRQADLTSMMLARMVQTNRTYISRYLNDHLNITKEVFVLT